MNKSLMDEHHLSHNNWKAQHQQTTAIIGRHGSDIPLVLTDDVAADRQVNSFLPADDGATKWLAGQAPSKIIRKCAVRVGQRDVDFLCIISGHDLQRGAGLQGIEQQLEQV